MSDNPFLLPPGGAKPSPVTPTGAPAEPVDPRDAGGSAPADPSHYIAVPASVESATHRIARPAPEPDEPVAESVAEPVAEPAPEPEHLAPEPPAPLAEETRVAPPAPPRAWALVLANGTRVSLDGPVLLGRDPAGIPDRPGAGLLPVADPGKTVSKTHALLEPTPGGVRVRDLHSTNGVAVDTAAGREVVAAGAEAIAPLGATIMLGSYPLWIATT
jgi:hypothetical protein